MTRSADPDAGAVLTLRSPRVERIPDERGITIRRGCTMLRIDGAGAADVLDAVLDLTRGPGSTVEALVSSFDPGAETAIRALVEELQVRRLLLPAEFLDQPDTETPLDVFYWHFGLPNEPSPTPPSDRTVIVVGQNRTSAHLCRLLGEAGFGQIVVVSDPDLNDPEPQPDGSAVATDTTDWRTRGDQDGGEPVVAVTDSGGFGPLRHWNELCLREGRPFLPVVVQDLVAYVGPLVVPGSTACFECFLRRRYSNIDDAGSREAVETHAMNGVRASALHPAITSIAADVAAIELTKFYLPWHAVRHAGYLLTMNLLASEFARRRVLKLPRCPACSSLNHQPSTTAVGSRLVDHSA